ELCHERVRHDGEPDRQRIQQERQSVRGRHREIPANEGPEYIRSANSWNVSPHHVELARAVPVDGRTGSAASCPSTIRSSTSGSGASSLEAAAQRTVPPSSTHRRTKCPTAAHPSSSNP